ncbi:vam6/Vps39-like protein [Centruroides vittatus]|uniref:vam6/Vps39-like protein n=1 Tax=Centruroides vittatus TaxID=120091 RepID=UPI00350FDEDF
MHEAYQPIKILKNLPVQIESLAAYEDNLLVATKQGHLLVYKVDMSVNPSKDNYARLVRSSKGFAKKPITQIEVVPDVQILISLSDNTISVHDLIHPNFQILTSISRTRGATLFALDIQKQKTLTGEMQCTVRMCVAVRRKLQLYYLKNREFLELTNDLGVPDVPKVIAWCGESLFVGFKSEYSLIKLTGDHKDLFPMGKSPEPLILRLENDQFALSRDEHMYIVDSGGNPTLKFGITWAEIPIALAGDPPYILAILANSVEVRTSERRMLIQNIEMKGPRIIVPCKKGFIFIASLNTVWCLCAVKLQNQIHQLLNEKEFELAMRLVNMTDYSYDLKQHYIQHIQNLYAFDLFCKGEFKEAMSIFLKLETDPSHIIGLFPNLLPKNYVNKLEYPDKLTEFHGVDLENGLLSLTEYLIQVRHELMGNSKEDLSSLTSIKEGIKTISSKKQLLEIIDTSLLKCYLQTNDALVSSLLRVQDNHCNVEESEEALKKFHKYSELIILYQRKGLHRKALEFLVEESKRIDSPFSMGDEIVRYLQHLGEEHLKLIFEFSDWILENHPNNGLKIFIEDLPEVESLPRIEVLNYLSEKHPKLTIPYLEHIIHVWKDMNSHFHDKLIREYCNSIRGVMKKYLDCLPEGQLPVQAGTEPGELGSLRSRLITFLEESEHYSLDKFPALLLKDRLYEEAAIVKGKLGKHEEALIIYTHILQAPEKAERYCIKNYKSRNEDEQIFFFLIKMYLCDYNKLNLKFLSAAGINIPIIRTDIKKSLQLLKKYASNIDPLETLSILPSTVSLNEIKEFLTYTLKKTESERHATQLVKSLLAAENLQVNILRIRCQSYKLVITELDVCRVCKKRIGTSAFGRFPNGVVVHYSCKEKYNFR